MPDSSPLAALLESARGHAARGAPAAARDTYRRALKAAGPSLRDVLVEFAIFEAGNDRTDSARNLLEKAYRLTPEDPAVVLNLGELARLAGDYKSAADHFRHALELMPDDADAACGLGDALLATGDVTGAIVALRRASALAPDDAEIHALLGDALARAGNWSTAVHAYRRAVMLDPGLRAASLGLAGALMATGRPAEAAGAFAGADRVGRLAPVQLCQWSRCLLIKGDHVLALDVAERAITADPSLAAAYHLCGVSLQQMGRFDDAEASLRRALSIDPGHADALEALAAMGRATLADARAVEQRLAAGTPMPPAARASAGFALYRIYDRMDDRANAFAALDTANAVKAAETPFDAASHIATVDAMIAAFDREFFDRLTPLPNHPATTPIFIVGLPRSGTTLAERILGACAGLHAGGERIPFGAVLGEALDDPARTAGRDNTWAAQRAAEIIATLTRDVSDARFVTDKTPGNYMALPFIAWMFPGAKVIHCRRDPRDVGFSCYEQNFRAGVSFAYRLDAFVCAYRSYERIWRHWQACCPVTAFELDYEDLVRDPETVARRMVAHCGLDWTPDSLDTTRSGPAIQTASFWQARQPINTRSIGKWRRYQDQLASFLEELGPVEQID